MTEAKVEQIAKLLYEEFCERYHARGRSPPRVGSTWELLTDQQRDDYRSAVRHGLRKLGH